MILEFRHAHNSELIASVAVNRMPILMVGMAIDFNRLARGNVQPPTVRVRGLVKRLEYAISQDEGPLKFSEEHTQIVHIDAY